MFHARPRLEKSIKGFYERRKVPPMTTHRFTLFATLAVLFAPHAVSAATPYLGRPGTAVFQYSASYSPPSKLPSLCRGQQIAVPVTVVNQGNLPWDVSKFHLS